MRAVVDTNVIVSGLISPGSTPARILSAARRAQFSLVTSESLIAELERALAYPRVTKYVRGKEERVRAFVGSLRGFAEVVSATPHLSVISADPDDNRVLEAAAAGGADYIVTGDNDLLRIERFEAVAIVTPAAFLAVLDAG